METQTENGFIFSHTAFRHTRLNLPFHHHLTSHTNIIPSVLHSFITIASCSKAHFQVLKMSVLAKDSCERDFTIYLRILNYKFQYQSKVQHHVQFKASPLPLVQVRLWAQGNKDRGMICSMVFSSGSSALFYSLYFFRQRGSEKELRETEKIITTKESSLLTSLELWVFSLG